MLYDSLNYRIEIKAYLKQDINNSAEFLFLLNFMHFILTIFQKKLIIVIALLPF